MYFYTVIYRMILYKNANLYKGLNLYKSMYKNMNLYKNLNPSWTGAKFVKILPADYARSVLSVDVYDEDKGKGPGDFLGKVSFDAARLAVLPNTKQDYELAGPDPAPVSEGEGEGGDGDEGEASIRRNKTAT